MQDPCCQYTLKVQAAIFSVSYLCKMLQDGSQKLVAVQGVAAFRPATNPVVQLQQLGSSQLLEELKAV